MLYPQGQAAQQQTVGIQTDPVPELENPCSCRAQQSITHNIAHDHSYHSKPQPAKPKSDIPNKEPTSEEADKQPEAPTPWFRLSLTSHPPVLKTDQGQESDGESDHSSTMSVSDGDSSSEYSLSPESDSDSAVSDENPSTNDPLSDPKFVVHKEHLLELFRICREPGCGKPIDDNPTVTTQGFCVSVTCCCIDGHISKWSSQPLINKIFASSLLIPAAVFITGSSYTTIMELFQAINLTALSSRQFYNLQKAYVIPEVEKMWAVHNEAVMAVVSEKPVVLSGDARCDSPGHCATFGTYTLLDADSHLIVAQETVIVTEVKNSYWLEPEGMQRGIDKLADHNVEISHLATDRHPTVQKIMREKYSTIKHEYDLWHIVKGVKKRISKTKDPDLMLWLRAIANHLWYCVATCNGDVSKLKDKGYPFSITSQMSIGGSLELVNMTLTAGRSRSLGHYSKSH